MYAQKTFESLVGLLEVIASEKGIREIIFAEGDQRQLDTPAKSISPKTKEHLAQLEKELKEYFAGKRKSFDVAVDISCGTDFQRKVWEALTEIPYGQTSSYKEVAEAVGRPKACRAVGGANNVNPLPIIIPCHRVVGSNGKLVGFAGGLGIKETLLKLEQG